ncbi:phosphonate C-P lyase system protein PhnH [Oscillatoria sp. FACHB-1407]|uniref:phosphonate C-P lyase system protein PhnH n=1 Tax=Oscillatoria sp. FACHB-1407 TaxID=2692847 RepID=UPI00168590A2|nr:phosphonate C-P lyase system protein PhnH [Oscillatoria sp. FACHB-1407]MBD2464138.1 phosphonate C-P lyase system protein PhnH [Oscillatoria sp. FACHB-1407]
MITTLPGFKDTVHDAQHTFRTVLDALARPGRVDTLTAVLSPPQGLMPACAATCLTLLDLETRVWLQPGWDAAVANWLVFHTGCRLVSHPQQATFALIWNPDSMPDLVAFHQGTAEYPELSTTLFLQLEHLHGGVTVDLTGPGILESRSISPLLPSGFWEQWRTNHAAYPLGVDVLLFSQDSVMGLPRTVKVSSQ